MLPARHRMRRSDDFARTVRSGSRAGSDRVVVHLLLAADLGPTPAEPARVGFVVSRAVGPAVQRNLVKRRLREIVAHRLDELPDGALAVVRALPPARDAGYAELRDDVARCLGVARDRQRRGGRAPSSAATDGRSGR